MQYKIAAIPMDPLRFQATSETFQMRYCMTFYLKGHKNCQESKLKVPISLFLSSKVVTLILQLVAVLMPLEIKRHTVPHLIGLNSGLEPLASHFSS